MITLYIGMALLFLLGMVSGMMIMIIHYGRKRKKIERIVPIMPDYNPNNYINGAPSQRGQKIETEYGPLYVMHPGV